MNKKKIYQEPTYHIIKVRSKLCLLDGSTAQEDGDGARQNDMDDY